MVRTSSLRTKFFRTFTAGSWLLVPSLVQSGSYRATDDNELGELPSIKTDFPQRRGASTLVVVPDVA